MTNNGVFDRGTINKIVIGTFVGVLAVWLAFRGVSINELWSVLSQANPLLVILGVLIVQLNVATLTLRWWVMLLRDWEFYDYATLLGGVYLGQTLNFLVPARLGELARIYYVSDRLEFTKSGLLGSLVLEKVLEVIAFGLAVLFLITAMTLPLWVTETGTTFLILGLVALIALIILLLWGRKILVWITPILTKLLGKWGDRIVGILTRALSGFDSMRSLKHQLPVWLLTFTSLFLSTITNFVILEAVQIKVPFSAALFVLIVMQVGNSPPSAPGKLGVFHYLAVLALSAFAVDKDLALAFGVLLYVVAPLPKVLVGVGVMIFSKWRLPDLQLRSDEIIERND